MAEDGDLVAARIAAEVAREPTFSKYPPVPDLAFAIEVALERIEEWDYSGDQHGWCHERPVLLSLVAAAHRQVVVGPARGRGRPPHHRPVSATGGADG